MSDETNPTFRTRRGRVLVAFGDAGLLTMDRLAEFERRIDADPRIVSLSLQPSTSITDTWLRGTAPAGPLIAVAQDAQDLVGPLPTGQDDVDALLAWCAKASERGLWHDWWLTRDRDVARAVPITGAATMDELEADDPSSAHFEVANSQPRKALGLTVNIDVTWLGPHETGAQVLTTAAIAAMANDPRIHEITLFGQQELPQYARHLTDAPNVRLATDEQPAEQADVVWYPNQIDGRSNVHNARQLGRRVITTYLDLIAYDIPRYHASTDAWAAYRALQRRIALSVDGITTISGDVAKRLVEEAPRLEVERIKPVILGLDHITEASVPEQPGEDIAKVADAMQGKRFVLVLGNDFQHKNRDFAIKVWQQTLQNGQACDLVLAGLHVKSSSSKASEDALIATHVDLRGKVHTLGHVSSDSRAWLLKHSAAVLYPSSAEGFGFVPYEAAMLSTPTTFADFGPLKEVSRVSGLPSRWQVDAFATDLTALLAHQEAAEQRVDELKRAIAEHTWADFATALIDHMQHVIGMHTVLTSTVADAESTQQQLAAVLSSRTFKIAQRLQRLKPGRSS